MPNCRINIFEPGIVLNKKWVILELIGKGAMVEPGSSSKVLERLTINSNNVKKTPLNESSPIEIIVSDTPKQSILAEDGASMHFVPAGMVTLPESNGLQPERSVKVNPFYMDETLVTNHQYVEFLNRNLSMIRVEKGVVQAEDEIWLLLGGVMEDYEPIVFQKGDRFEFKVQIETKDKNNRTYSNPLIIDEMLPIVSK